MADTTITITANTRAAEAAIKRIQTDLAFLSQNAQTISSGFSKVGDNLAQGLKRAATAATVVTGAVGLLSKSFISTGSEVENLGVRFKFLFGSLEEGNKAFQALIDYAGKVPFSLEEIQRSSGSLAVVSKNADELSKNLQLVGNVAALSGLDFQTAAEQVQRTFSSGIASAELFRERGVKALLGFKDGVQYSAEESRAIFEKELGPGGRFSRAALEMSTTFTGVLSMIGDKVFQFKKDVADAGLFDFAKSIALQIDTLMTSQAGSMKTLAQQVSDTIISMIRNVTLGAARIYDSLLPVFKFLADGISTLLAVVNNLPPGVKELGVIGFLMLGRTGKLLVVVIGGLINEIRSLWGSLVDGFAKGLFAITKIFYDLGLVSEEAFSNALENFKNSRTEVQNLKTDIQDLNDTISQGVGGPAEKFFEDLFKGANEQLEKLKENAKTDIPLPGTSSGGGGTTTADDTTSAIDEQAAAYDRLTEAATRAGNYQIRVFETAADAMRGAMDPTEQIAAIEKINQITETRAALLSEVSNLSKKDQESATRAINDITTDVQLLGLGYEQIQDKIRENIALYVESGQISQEAADQILRNTVYQTEAIRQGTEKVYEANKRIYDQTREFGYGWKKTMEDYVEDATNAAKQAEQVFRTAVGSLENVFLEFFKTGELNWKKFVAAILEELLLLELRKFFAKVFEDVLGEQESAFSKLMSQLSDLKTAAQFISFDSILGNVINAGKPQPTFDWGQMIGGVLSNTINAGRTPTTFPGQQSTSISGQIGDFIGGALGGLFGRASGGPVTPGTPYLVGEMGPELFIPDGSGRISNNVGGTNVINYNINAVDAASFKSLVARDPEFIYSITELGKRNMGG